MGQDSSRISHPTRDAPPPLLSTYPAANITRNMAQNNNHLPPSERQARQGTEALSSRMNGPFDTTIDRSNTLDRQEARMVEDRPAHSGSRKRWRNDARDVPFEEKRQVRRARIGSSSYSQPGGLDRVTRPLTFQDALDNWRAHRGPMTAIRVRQSRYPSGSRTIHRQEQEQERISSTFANIDPPDRWRPVNSIAGANHSVQPSITPSLHAPNLRKRLREEDSDADCEESDGDRHRKVRRRGEERTPFGNVRAAAYRPRTSHRFPNHTMRMNSQSQIAREDESQILDITNTIENHNLEAASLPAPDELPAAEASSNQNHQSNTGRVIIDLMLDDTDFEPEIPSGQQTPRSPSLRGSWPEPDVIEWAYIGDTVLAIKERRLRPFEQKPHSNFKLLLQVVENLKMYMLSRKLVTQGSRHIAEEFSIVGAHGNLHKVTIANEPRCDCCRGAYGLPCWHVLFILKKILKAPEPLCYQFALLDVELEWMLTRDLPDNYCQRRSINEQELCYICHEDLSTNENILTWCKAQCGVSFHRDCVLEWAASKWGDERFSRGETNIHCGVCRQPWVFTGEELLEVIRTGQNGHIYKAVGGYTNVATIFGMTELPMSEEEFEERKLELFQEGHEALTSTLRQMSEAESQVYRRHVLEVGGDRLRCVIIQQLRREDKLDAWTEAYIRLHHPMEVEDFRRAMYGHHVWALEKWRDLTMKGLLMDLIK